MTLILNQADWDALHEQAPMKCYDNSRLDDFEEWTGVPELIGCGYSRRMELSPGVWLNFSDCKFNQDLRVEAPAHEHPIQIGIFLSGFIYFDAVHPNLGGSCSYFSGSGISPGYVEKYRGGERLTAINIEIEPNYLSTFLQADPQYDTGVHSLLFKGENWKVAVYPTLTSQMRSLVQQMWNAPYRGIAKRLYLQAKVFELLALYLDLIVEDAAQRQSPSGLKPDTIDRLHHAKDLLTTQFENPPSLPDLAQQVGVSDRTLQRGFNALFNTTVVGYLKQCRLEQAERLLRHGDRTVAEVANLVGYGHLGHFAAAFKQQFGITPSQCLRGKGLTKTG
ncbi:MAG: AraC family transcriptional regulator [Leptolyngbyaceae bacterium]|nr:AraC family transcriptional regulator [Leptolyngbyaceae bacterium]